MTAPPEPMPALLEIRGVSKTFAGVTALDGVGLTVEAGQIVAVLGENGAGKSTLMKILSGVHRPDAGSILLDGEVVHLRNPQDAQARGISIIYQEFSLIPHLDVVENLFLGRERTSAIGTLRPREMEKAARAILDRLGARIPLRRPVAELSVAEQQFVEIAKALLRETRLLIMDEPTATLTPQETGRLFQLMRDLRNQGVGIIFISHHLEEIFEVADRVVCLRDGRCVGERLRADCSREELIRLMVGRDVAQAYPLKPDTAAGEPLLEVRHLQRKPHLPDVSFCVRPGEILGVAGLVGSGRTKLVRALIGADPAFRRELYLQGKLVSLRSPADAREAGIGLVPEDRKQQGLVLGASIADNVVLAGLTQLCHRTWRWVMRSRLAAKVAGLTKQLSIKAATLEQPVRTLSGGNQQKVVLGKWLHAGCKVLIFDEPTRGIDVGAKAEIYQLMRQLAAQGRGIVMISSELPEVIGMSDRLLVVRKQRIEHVFERGEVVRPEEVISYATGGCHA